MQAILCLMQVSLVRGTAMKVAETNLGVPGSPMIRLTRSVSSLQTALRLTMKIVSRAFPVKGSAGRGKVDK